MFVKCTCKHEYQDKMYNGRKVANPVNKSRVQGALKAVRCTVCRTVHTKWDDK